MITNKPYPQFFFGDAQYCVEPSYFREKKLSSKELILKQPFFSFYITKNFNALVFLHQQHGDNGIIITDEQKAQRIPAFCKKGDFLITTVSKIGIGIVTADCLPVFVLDKKNWVIAAVHSGWRGTALSIVPKVIGIMCNDFGSIVSDLEVFFGPCAKSCCYQVQKDFLKNIQDFEFYNQVIIEKDDKIFFDNLHMVKLQLNALGLLDDQVSLSNLQCTMCTQSFCSFRNGSTSRNVSFISI